MPLGASKFSFSWWSKAEVMGEPPGTQLWGYSMLKLLKDLDLGGSEALFRGAIPADDLRFRALGRHGCAYHGAGVVSKQAWV